MEDYEEGLAGDETLNPYGKVAVCYYVAVGILSLFALAHLVYTF